LTRRIQGRRHAMAVDPVCRMPVSEEQAEYRSEYRGRTYWFCAAGCKERFEKDPEKYLADERPDWVRG